MKHNVLITGGLGYVGGRIANAFQKDSNYFTLLSTRQSDPTPPAWIERGKMISLNLLSDDDLNFACQGVEYIVHLASINEIECLENPEQALLINGLGTLKLLQAAERAGVKRFIYFSTAPVYGKLVGKITENTLPIPIHPYAITHRIAEDFVIASHEQRKMQGIVIRLSNGFGVPMNANVNRWTLIANDLCRQAVTTGKLVLRSSGVQRRDFITLEDVGRAVQHVIRLPELNISNPVFNLGGENPMRILDLAEQIAGRCTRVLGYTPPIILPDVDDANEKSLPLDYCIDKLKSTGFSILGNIDSEIDATLQLCKNVLERGH